jgi:predicted nucleic acid-binding protein
LRVLFDTNVVLDLLLDREPFSTAVAHLFSQVERGAIHGYLCATTITTIHYLTEKVIGAERANKEIGKLLSLFEIAPVNRAVLESALRLKMKDFEDAVVCEAASQAKVQAIVTRDARGFKNSKLPIYTPDELTHIIRISGDQTE